MAPRNKNIGAIGKTVLTTHEKEIIRYIGRCIALLGHTLVIIPAKGVADMLREGVEAEGGVTTLLDAGVIDHSDQTLVYPDKRLLTRLTAAYPDLQERSDVVVIEDHQLEEWLEAIKSICRERNIKLPA